jgi:hypothetical protein
MLFPGRVLLMEAPWIDQRDSSVEPNEQKRKEMSTHAGAN